MVAHVTGDAGVDVVLDAIEAAQKRVARRSAPHADSRLLRQRRRRPRAPRVSASSSTPSPPGTTRTPTRCRTPSAAERVAHFIGLNTWRRAGVEVAINTDHMFGLDKNEAMNPFNPFLTIYAATTRRTESGRVVSAADGVSRQEALRMMTRTAARFSFDEKNRGSIEVGKLGDFVVLDDHLLTCPAARLRTLRADMTVIGGRVAHERK